MNLILKKLLIHLTKFFLFLNLKFLNLIFIFENIHKISKTGLDFHPIKNSYLILEALFLSFLIFDTVPNIQILVLLINIQIKISESYSLDFYRNDLQQK